MIAYGEDNIELEIPISNFNSRTRVANSNKLNRILNYRFSINNGKFVIQVLKHAIFHTKNIIFVTR